MKESERCRHPDCVYRNRIDPEKTGNCEYCRMTGKPRLSMLPGALKLPMESITYEMKLPVNCPFYKPDGVTPPEPVTEESWKDAARLLYDDGATDREIADTLGMGITRVANLRRRNWKLPPNPDKRGPDIRLDYERAEELYRRGMNDREIAEGLACSVSAVLKWRNKYELLPNSKGGRKPKKKETDCHTSAAALARNDGEGES